MLSISFHETHIENDMKNRKQFHVSLLLTHPVDRAYLKERRKREDHMKNEMIVIFE
jgi:hypothetical protein